MKLLARGTLDDDEPPGLESPMVGNTAGDLQDELELALARAWLTEQLGEGRAPRGQQLEGLVRGARRRYGVAEGRCRRCLLAHRPTVERRLGGTEHESCSSSHTEKMLRHARLREYARAHPWLAVAGASALTMGLVELVSALSGTLAYQHLLWNLFLAWVPLPIAGAAYVAHRRGRGLATIAPFLIGWLLFFPNAPYMVTELIHFGELGSRIPAGLDLATLITAAIAGLLVGFASLYVVQRVIGHLFGPAAAGAAVLLALTLGERRRLPGPRPALE